MSYVSLIIPFVLGYIAYIWRAINSKKVNEEELAHEEHAY
jgi:cytochrome d ubiquinol oxidase subunit II